MLHTYKMCIRDRCTVDGNLHIRELCQHKLIKLVRTVARSRCLVASMSHYNYVNYVLFFIVELTNSVMPLPRQRKQRGNNFLLSRNSLALIILKWINNFFSTVLQLQNVNFSVKCTSSSKFNAILRIIFNIWSAIYLLPVSYTHLIHWLVNEHKYI